MKKYTLTYLAPGDTEPKTFEFYADSKELANDHATHLCKDRGWALSQVRAGWDSEKATA